jgi:hypothetical protein
VGLMMASGGARAQSGGYAYAHCRIRRDGCHGVNGSGQTVGSIWDSAGKSNGFPDANGALTTTDDPMGNGPILLGHGGSTTPGTSSAITRPHPSALAASSPRRASPRMARRCP